jgi:uncharacterized protein (DUF885 family)
MIDNVGMTGQDATSEVERYFVDPGQALAVLERTIDEWIQRSK